MQGSSGPTVHVCRLATRHAREWRGDGEEGRRLRAALDREGHQHPHGRYTCLVDRDEDIHLVRLAHDGLSAKAVPA